MLDDLFALCGVSVLSSLLLCNADDRVAHGDFAGLHNWHFCHFYQPYLLDGKDQQFCQNGVRYWNNGKQATTHDSFSRILDSQCALGRRALSHCKHSTRRL